MMKILKQNKKYKKQKDDKTQQEIDLTRLKDEIDVGEIPREIKFYFRGEITTFF